ncbi:SRPBCC domain-containing protein [Bdellovibrio bacteriovorus]|uniref:SRPBCC family protein n=1 Tax=Bdellovibrio bacteriovorus TaxID=959 RepID=UPI0021D264A3|nr:SRPBCC domain-containing protein [Bdellovibrio bacteriovorus]UXR63959.1 SRPBCC domain-containing protein [Bdellovibrio bacteriovorus]
MQTSQAKGTQSSVHKQSTPTAKLLEMDRKFNVPVDQLFAAFATSESLKKWWWPEGIYTDQVDLEFREGGRYFINMKGYEQGSGGMTGHFEEIVTNQRIVMTDQFADTDGNAISPEEAKMPGQWPEMAYITFEFEALDNNTSRFKLSQEGIPNEFQKDCIQGWSESFDKLEKYLSDRRH